MIWTSTEEGQWVYCPMDVKYGAVRWFMDVLKEDMQRVRMRTVKGSGRNIYL